MALRYSAPERSQIAVDITAGAQNVLLTATVVDPDNNLDRVIVDLSSITGSPAQTMYDDGDTEDNGDEVAGDGIYSYRATVAQSATSGYKSLFVTAADLEGLTGKNNIALTVTNAGIVIVDNPVGAPTGSWPTSTYTPGYYGANYQYHAPGTGTDTFTWTPAITISGTYEVFARWTSDSNRAPDATYTIYHDGVDSPTSVPPVDQRSNGGQWVSLGTYSFHGTGDYVELRQSPHGYVIADAVKFVLQ